MLWASEGWKLSGTDLTEDEKRKRLFRAAQPRCRMQKEKAGKKLKRKLKEMLLRLSGGDATLHTLMENTKREGDWTCRRAKGQTRTDRGWYPPAPSVILDAAAHLSWAAPTRFFSARFHSSTANARYYESGRQVSSPMPCLTMPPTCRTGFGSCSRVQQRPGMLASRCSRSPGMTTSRQSGRHPAQFRASVIDAGWLSESLFRGVCSCISDPELCGGPGQSATLPAWSSCRGK
ncbi:hypothetical protein CGRA01v4_11461 [Colletotrichum graminicola]|nr:hypothetical protein CGRA01v4_11461 [Colletotrichum graminicola]